MFFKAFKRYLKNDVGEERVIMQLKEEEEIT